MKLFVVAALIAVAAAGRLEHLERSYLPPDYSTAGSHGGFGSPSSHGSFGAAGSGFPSYNAGGSFPGATSNQYLPPDHGPSASSGVPQFSGSLQGFGGQDYRTHQYAGFHGGAPQASSSFGAPNYQAQYPQPSASRQYLAPHTSSFQNPPQQAFDEETGYHY